MTASKTISGERLRGLEVVIRYSGTARIGKVTDYEAKTVKNTVGNWLISNGLARERMVHKPRSGWTTLYFPTDAGRKLWKENAR